MMNSKRPRLTTQGPTRRVVDPPLTEILYADWRDMRRSWVRSWKAVFSERSLPQDLLAGLTVAAVALPLNLALAVASGLPPVAGLVGGAIGGLIAGFAGGTPLQVTGPAAALNVMVFAIATQFGATGVAAACLMIGIIQLALAFSRAGHLAQFVPESVLAGFTTGVGLKLLDTQLPELMGFDYRVVELAAMMHRPAWLREVNWLSVVSGLFVAFLVVSTRRFQRFPAAIVGVGIVTFIANYIGWDIPRVGEVPDGLPPATIPLVADDQWLDLALAAFPLALLAAVESLLSASAVKRMTNGREVSQPSLELVGQGLANLGVSFFAGMPVSGVVVRSGLNVQSGGRTRLSAISHALILGSAVILLSTELARVPLAALAGLLCVIGFRLVEFSTLIHLARHERIEAIAFAVTGLGTVTGHLMLGLGGGLLIHAVNRYLHRSENAERAQIAHERQRGIRALLPEAAAGARKGQHDVPAGSALWMPNVRARPSIATTAFVHPQAAIIGPVILADHVHVAAGSSIRADEGAPFFIGPNSNVQDGVVIHALKDKRVQVGAESWAVYIGRDVSLAHDALVHGPCYVGDHSFIGFKAVVHDSIVGSHCFIGIGAVVVGVEIPDGKFVPHGTIVDSRERVDALPNADEAQHHFNEDVVDVNRGLAAAYRALALKPHDTHLQRHQDSRKTPWVESWSNDLASNRF